MNIVRKLINAKDVYLSVSQEKKKHAFKMTDIENLSKVKKDGKTCLHVTLTNGDDFYTLYRKFSLNRKGKIALSTLAALTAGTMAASIAGFKYTKDGENVKLSDEKINTSVEEIFYEDEDIEDTYENEAEIVTFNYPNESENISLADAMDINNMQAELATYEVAPVIENLRTLTVDGDQTRGIDAYNRVIDNYYDDILEFGITYGIDPAIIAAMMMEEGGTEYNPNAEEKYSAIGFGQVNGNIWNNYTFHVFNYNTCEYEYYTLDVNNIKNNPREQIKLMAIMLQTSAVTYNGYFSAITEDYNKGCGTVSNITSNILSSGDYQSKEDIYSSDNALLIFEYNTYTLGDPEYTNRIVTYMDLILENEVFGKNYASIVLPDGNVYNYQTNVQNKIIRT